MTNRKICKKVLEAFFKVPFKRATINGHVIDFYNENLRIGLVYNSIHRYKFSFKFHKTRCHFLVYKNECELRSEACHEAGIRLVTVSYNTKCFPGLIRRRLGIPNSCKCSRCLAVQPLYINEDYSK